MAQPQTAHALVAHSYERSLEQLQAVARRYVGEDAEDIVHDVFVRLLERGSSFRGDASPNTFLYRIVVNACLDEWRRRRRIKRTPVETGSAASIAPTPLDMIGIRRAVRRLGRTQRDTWMLYDVLGYTHREIARMQGIPVGTSKNRVSLGRRSIRRHLSAGEAVSA